MLLETKLKSWSLAKWKKEFWKVFSKYIRERDKYSCFTCPVAYGSKENLPYPTAIQAGHYRTGATCNLLLYFDERNVHAQCYQCNINLSGNWYEYQKRMHLRYGEEIDQEFDRLNRGVPKWDKHDYLAKIKEYEEKLSTLES